MLYVDGLVRGHCAANPCVSILVILYECGAKVEIIPLLVGVVGYTGRGFVNVFGLLLSHALFTYVVTTESALTLPSKTHAIGVTL